MVNGDGRHCTYRLSARLALPHYEDRQLRRHHSMYLVQDSEDLLTLFQSILQIPRVMDPRISLWIDMERRLQRNAKVMSRPTKSPKEIRI